MTFKTLRLTFNRAPFPIGFARVSHAVRKNEFKERVKIDLGVMTRNGEESATFTLPAGAGG